MDLTKLDRLLGRSPVVVQGLHPVSLAYLSEPVRTFASLEELALLLDDSNQAVAERVVVFDVNPVYASRFPVVTVRHNPFTPHLNAVLLDRYDYISSAMLNQSQVSDRILSIASHLSTIVLVLLDGLSYYDCRSWPGVEPCLATHPTITRVGFPCVLGDPPLAARLFRAGFARRVGFTYWTRADEQLTNRLYRTISDTRRLDPGRPDTFREILDWLESTDLDHTYVQIVHSALDDYADGHRTRVPRKAVVDQLHSDLRSILRVLEQKGLPACLFATSDHGILWKEDEHPFRVVPFHGVRYMEARSGPGRGRCFRTADQWYWVLDYPQLGRHLHSDEQGVHGGVSFEESIVPFVQWEVKGQC